MNFIVLKWNCFQQVIVFSANEEPCIIFPLQLSSWVNYILMEKFYGFEVVISKSWRIQRNCINEKLDAEIQKDQR